MAKKKIPAEVAEIFRAFGKQGGKKRSKNLTPEQRSEIARKAGKAGGRGRKKAG
jgi:general stress protein YciG